MFAIERYSKAHSLEEAVKLLAADPAAKLIAGGTDVLIRLHEGSKDFKSLVDINGLAALKEITEAADGTVRIGCLATFSEIMDSDVVNRRVPVIAEAAATVGGPQLRNMATMGGNICAGVPCADSAGALLVLEADLEIRGVDGQRVVPVAGFHLGPSRVALKQEDVLVGFRIRPANYKGLGAAYYKYTMRDAMDIATIGCAVACKLKDGKVEGLRLAFAVAGPTPLRCWRTEEKSQGALADESLLKLVAGSVLDDLRPRDSWRASKDFREQIITTLAERVLREAINRQSRNGVSIS